jgi:hypothetical protein
MKKLNGKTKNVNNVLTFSAAEIIVNAPHEVFESEVIVNETDFLIQDIYHDRLNIMFLTKAIRSLGFEILDDKSYTRESSVSGADKKFYDDVLVSNMPYKVYKELLSSTPSY